MMTMTSINDDGNGERAHGSSRNSGPFWYPVGTVPYYFGDLQRDPNLENYPEVFQKARFSQQSGQHSIQRNVNP